MTIGLELAEVPKVLEFLDQFVNRVNILQERLHADLKVLIEDDTRLFGLGQKEAVLAHEVLTYYFSAWPRLLEIALTSGRTTELAYRELLERIRATLAQQFISTMSLVEFSAKESIKVASGSGLAAAVDVTKARVYLRVIAEKSRRLNLISRTDLETWLALIEIRNILVHNNGIADTPATYQIAGLTVQLVPGEMTETDTFLFFPKITAEAVLKYHDWLRILFGAQRDRGRNS